MVVPKPRFQIFLSSTFTDLQVERVAVTQALLRMQRCIPAGMEFFPASSRPPWDVIRPILDVTDYMVLLLAGRYGSVTEDASGTRNANMTMHLGKTFLSSRSRVISIGEPDSLRRLASDTSRTTTGKAATGHTAAHHIAEAMNTVSPLFGRPRTLEHRAGARLRRRGLT